MVLPIPEKNNKLFIKNHMSHSSKNKNFRIGSLMAVKTNADVEEIGLALNNFRKIKKSKEVLPRSVRMIVSDAIL